MAAKGSASAVLSADRRRATSLQLGDTFLRILEVVGLLEFLDQTFVIGEGFRLLRRVAAIERFGEVEVHRVPVCETRVSLEHFAEPIDRAGIVLEAVVK